MIASAVTTSPTASPGGTTSPRSTVFSVGESGQHRAGVWLGTWRHHTEVRPGC